MKQFLSYIHSFRAIAILFIVAGHSIFLFEWRQSPELQQLLRSVFQNGSVLFVFVAGFLFQHLSRKFEYRRYLKSKLLNVVSPYLVVSVPMLAAQIATQRGTFDPSRSQEFPTLAHNIAWNLLTGNHVTPFWFIPMICVFYLLAPLLLWLDRDGRAYWLLPGLLLVTVLVHRPEQLSDIGHACVYFLPVYLFGMACSKHRVRLLELVHRFLGPLTVLVLGLVVVEVFVLERGGALLSQGLFSTENGVVDTNAIQKLLLCWVLMGWLDRFDKQVAPRIAFLADLSFGLFFLHMIWIRIYTHTLLGDVFPAGSLLRYLALVAAVVALSVVVLVVAKKILGKRSRMVVGC